MRRYQSVGLGLAALGVAALAGCGEPDATVTSPAEPTTPIEAAAPVSATYVCDSGLTVAVAYPDPQSAQVTYKDRTWVMRLAPAASGARYVNAEVEWRTVTREGEESATLSRLGATEDAGTVVLERCRRPGVSALPVTPVPTVEPAPAGSIQASAPCKGPQLKLSRVGGDAGAGNRVSILGVQNVGTRPCSLTGYPSITLEDPEGDALAAVRSDRTLGSYLRPGQTPGPVELAPQGLGFFDIAWNVVPDESAGRTTCPSVARIRMTAPGDTSPVTLAQAFTPCGGRIRISPFRTVAEPEPAA
ncbi:MAG: DUF4232 domain-containing protein [Brevundimonas sp.]|uniref:DUF4232 domain-containing protein n=1 Tax=Brevundimonas sp. TaxID=1871086 RepID=UPI00263273B0|nr:DUF4232 domain-containing protein [Brevundimonas sp.]MDI6624561.1 DUF4232 domain-containing protein [Brevundimonas sp.]MDQ7812174.1 DUF4232 domain-containing protein [Brevundimonas sp.]